MSIRAGDNLKALLARVKRATSVHGKKKELAEFLAVPSVCVSQWLSLSRAPNGEITLLMQKWVIVQEHNKNAPGSDRTPPGARPVQLNPDMKKEKKARAESSAGEVIKQTKKPVSAGPERRTVSFRFPKVWLPEIDRLAASSGITRSEFIEMAIRHEVGGVR